MERPALTEGGAYLLGLIAADGHVQIEKSKEGWIRSYKVSVNCGNSEGDEEFAEHVCELMRGIWGIPATNRHVPRTPPRIPYWSPTVYRKKAVEWVNFYTDGQNGSHDWVIPPAVRQSDRLLCAWVSGFADGDGSMIFLPPKRYVSLSSVNLQSLASVGVSLQRVGIRTCGPYPRSEDDDRSNLLITDRRSLEVFADKVGFRQPEKARKLVEALASYQRSHANLLSHEVDQALPEVLRRRAAGEAFSEIASAMGLATTEIPKGMVKRAAKAAGKNCLVCQGAPATHSIPRVVRGRSGKYACDPCLTKLEPEVETWGDELVKLKTSEVAEFLDEHHYLGRRGGRSVFALRNKSGALVFSTKPQAGSLPRDGWLELSRWCLTSEDKNAGSRHWARTKRWLLQNTDATTVVTYSDPSRHDGALYRAAGFLWAPSTQFLLKNMKLAGERHEDRPYVDKNRWVYPLRPDDRRQEALTIRHPWLYNSTELKFLCDWNEPRWKRGRWTGGGKDYARWRELLAVRS